jgi:eukaryotic-like serine/threonine-protein kinase
VAAASDKPIASAPPKATAAPPSTGTGTETPSRRSSSSRGASSVKMGQLSVFCTPACDEVLDGGRSLGPSPVFKVSVPLGPHRITLVSTDPPVRKVVSVVVSDDEVAVVREAMGGP